MQLVKYTQLRPAEFRERLKQKPLAYLPMGTLEWHGEHLPLGTDAIESEALMVECAMKFGGIVLPPLFLGPDRRMDLDNGEYLVGMDYAKSTSPNQQLTGSCYWVRNDFFKQLLEHIIEQIKRAGFKAVFAIGHGPSQRIWNEMIPEWKNQYGMTLIGTTDLGNDWEYMIDHAARNETSITMHVEPSLVDLSVFREAERSPLVGVNGIHPFLASKEYGEELFSKAIRILEPVLKNV